MSHVTDVLILGGGLAGGVCARTLISQGCNVQVIEREDTLGGLLRSVKVAGCEIDRGPHFFFHPREFVGARNWIHSLVETADCQPFAWSLPDGRLDQPHDYPVSERNAQRWPDSARILDELHQARAFAATAHGQSSGTDFAGQLRSLVGDTLYRRYFERYTSKFWGVPPAKLAGDWAPRKIRITEQHEPFFGDKLAYRPTSGFACFVDKLYDEVPVICDDVIGLKTAGNEVVGVRCRHRGVLTASQYISTIPPDRLVGRYSLAVRSVLLVYAVLDNPVEIFSSAPDVQWAYLPNNYSFTRVSDMTKCCLLGAEAPRVLCFEFPCDYNQALDSTRIRDEVRAFLAEMPSETRADVSQWNHCWIPEAYPIPSRDNETQLRGITEALDRIGNLHRTGRFGAFRFTWMADIIMDALEIADAVVNNIRSQSCDA